MSDIKTPAVCGKAVCGQTLCGLDITSLRISKKPNKTVYLDGEIFDPTGMIVTGSSSSGDSVTITDYTVETNAPLISGSNMVTVRYMDKTANFYVTVNSRICLKAMPATESIGFASGVSGDLYLGTGEFSAAFSNMKLNVGSLSYGIDHIFKNNGENHNCGNGWRLNLHSSLKTRNGISLGQYIVNNSIQDAATLGEVDYIYTDGAGNRYSFDEVFYYLDDNNSKHYVNKNTVQIDLDGELYYKPDDNTRYTVVRELKTVLGYKLSTKIDYIDYNSGKVGGIDKIDQRNEEIAKLETEIQQYRDAISELEFNIEQYEASISGAPSPSSAIINKVSYGTGVTLGGLTRFDSHIERVINDTQQMINNLSVPKDVQQDDSLQDAEQLWALRKYNADLNSFYYNYTKNSIKNRKNELNSQQERQLEEYNRILGQKEQQLTVYKRQVPVAYLISDENTLCFNEDGNLCGIVDNFDNTIAIIWDEIYVKGRKDPVLVIKTVNYGEHESTFNYDAYGRLKCIHEHAGKHIEYKYNSSGCLDRVLFNNAVKYMFTYDNNGLITSVKSPDFAEGAELLYTDNKLTSVAQKTSFNPLHDEHTQPLYHDNTVSEINISYNDGMTSIESDGVTNTYYLDYYGNLAASYAKDSKGFIERPKFAYKQDDSDTGYTVQETAEAIWTKVSASASSNRLTVISSDALPKGVTEFAFSAEANVADSVELTNYGRPFVLPFRSFNNAGANSFCLTVKITQNNSVKTYTASFDYRNRRAQYMSLPFTVDSSLGVAQIELYVTCSSSSVSFKNLRVAPTQWEYREVDNFGNVKLVKTSNKPLTATAYTNTETVYTYDDNNRLVFERAAIKTSNATTKHAVKRYCYCEHGNLVKSESYIEEDVNSHGIDITERVCDDKGRIIKEFSYNSLDSSTKFYKESEISDNGVITADIDETGECKTEYEYADEKVKARKLPNGGKLSYGYDENGNVTAITQSTDDGEGNSTELKYTYGSPTRLTSGNNTVLYSYDTKRRIKSVEVNGVETVYDYSGSKFDNTPSVQTPVVTIKNFVFNAVTADRVTETREYVTAETYMDKRGNTVMTKLGGEVMAASLYNTDGTLDIIGDNKTSSIKKYTYSNDALKTLTKTEILSGTDVEALTENYYYDNYGQISSKNYSGSVQHGYSYYYNDDTQRTLKCIGLPNALTCYPQTDVNGRNTGKEIKKPANDNIYGEYIYYRKVGDHGTNMPSSIYYGKTKNGQYCISDNIKYKYDEMGNISEIKENGLLAVKYTYDKIGRLVREDNRKLGKSIFISYDNSGNILSKREAQFTFKPTDEIEVFTEEKLYAYNGDKLVSYGSEAIGYSDEQHIERLTPFNYRGHDLAWNYGRQLVRFGDNTFTYDGYGRRIKKNDTLFTYDANNTLIKQSDCTDTLEFIYDTGLSGVTYNGTEYIYSKDVQGNIVGILDNTGREVVQYAYDAWGNCKTTVLDETHAGIAELNPFRYRSYYYDTETHLYYLNTRYYDPEVGRFISQDDVSYLDPEHINGLNLFAYCGNNPVMGYDPDGTWDWGKFWNILGSVVTAIVATAAVVGGIILTVASCGATLPATVAFGLTVLGGALIGGGVAMVSNLQAQIQSNGWGNVDLGETWKVGGIGFVLGGVTSALSFGVGQIVQSVGQTFGFLLSNTKIGGLLVSKVFSTSLLMNVFGIIGKVLGGACASFFGDYIGNNAFYSSYTEDNAKETAWSIFLGWLLEFFGRFA